MTLRGSLRLVGGGTMGIGQDRFDRLSYRGPKSPPLARQNVSFSTIVPGEFFVAVVSPLIAAKPGAIRPSEAEFAYAGASIPFAMLRRWLHFTHGRSSADENDDGRDSNVNEQSGRQRQTEEVNMQFFCTAKEVQTTRRSSTTWLMPATANASVIAIIPMLEDQKPNVASVCHAACVR